MHNAPAVSYPVGRSHIRLPILLLPWLLGGVACLVWAWQSRTLGASHGLALLVWLMCGALVARDVRSVSQGVLRWDGVQWTWEDSAGGRAGTLLVRLDVQRWLLVEFHPLEGPSLWLWPQRDADAIHWDGLRRALCAPLAGSAATGGQPAS